MAHTAGNGVCRRCGTCCRKGGPAIHIEDRRLVDDGILPARDLFTIREGEPAHENVRGHIAPAATDIIKIKGTGGSWRCRYLCAETNTCRIYTHRPLECRVLSCRDTTPIGATYDRNRLTRKMLLETVPGLWELIAAHQQRCDYGTILALHARLKKNPAPEASRQLRETIIYDRSCRQTLVEKGRIDPHMLDFLLGRPLTQTLPLLGITA